MLKAFLMLLRNDMASCFTEAQSGLSLYPMRKMMESLLFSGCVTHWQDGAAAAAGHCGGCLVSPLSARYQDLPWPGGPGGNILKVDSEVVTW